MKFNKIRAGLLACGFVLLGMSSAYADPVNNLLQNGDFENLGAGYQVPADPGYLDFVNGATIGAWKVGGNSVDLIGYGLYGAIDGVSVDLSGWDAGTLSQTFDATAGVTYLLSFQHSLNGGGTDMGVSVSDGGQFYENQTYFAASVNGIATDTLSWTAASTGTETVTFSGGAGTNGPTLDNVVLTAVPEPSGVALALAGLGAVAFVRRRKA